MATTMIVDASVAIKWFIEEDRSDEARSILAGEAVHAPGVIRIEVAHVLWKSARRGILSIEALSAALAAMERNFPLPAPTDGLIRPAIDLMKRIDHPVYDCLYLALAEREGIPLVTADERQYAAARKARIEARLL
jgi:predicted nucleic acid-binding protein